MHMHHDPSSSSSSLPAGPGLRPGISPVDSPRSLRDQVHMGTKGMASVGHPICFAAGQFSGCTIRMELKEIQKADLGRKYAQVDRRPLDPPPVVHLRIFKVKHAGTEKVVEKEVDYESVEVLGFICTLDLFPVPDSFAPSQLDGPRAGNPTNSKVRQTPLFMSPSSPSTSSTQSSSCEEQSLPRSVHDLCPTSSAERQNQSTECSNDVFPSPASTEVLHRLGNYPITESTKRTQALSGGFVQAEKLEYQGKKAILFPFTDLAVKIEGTFILRYRVFDLFSYPSLEENTAVIGAETYGSPFHVYSTKDFPGLRPSTDLTKSLARWGVRVNTRETERRRKGKSDDSVKSFSSGSQSRAPSLLPGRFDSPESDSNFPNAPRH